MNTYVWFAIISITLVSATRYGRFLGKTDIIAPMDMALDTDHMVSVAGTPQPLPPNFIQTVNYHDFVSGFLAHKHIDGKVCYIRKTNETYQQAKAVLDSLVPGVDNIVYQGYIYTVKLPNPLTNVKGVAGVNIENFCHGYDAYYLHVTGTKGNGRKNARSPPQVMMRPWEGTLACLIANVHIATLRPDVLTDLLAQGGLGGTDLSTAV